MEIFKNSTFIVPLFMFTLTNFILTFNEWEMTIITLRLTILDLGFRVEERGMIFRIWNLGF